MSWISTYGLRAAFVLGMGCVGLPFWLQPYNRVNVPDALYGPGLLVVGVLALVMRARGIAGFWRTSNVMAATVPAAVMARVIVEGLADPTRHNLWPLAILIAAAVGYAAAIPGAVVGHLVWLLRTARAGR